MTTNYKTVFFDWDGTLVDNRHSMLIALNKSLSNIKNISHQKIDDRLLISVAGLQREDAFFQMFPNLSDTQREELINEFILTYDGVVKNQNLLREGAFQFLESALVSGIVTGIITNRKKNDIVPEILQYNLNEMFNVIVTTDIMKPKPSTEMMEYALRQTGSVRESTLYVGDTINDYLMSQKSQVTFLLYGAAPTFESVLGMEYQTLINFTDLESYFE